MNRLERIIEMQGQSFNLYISEENWNYKYMADIHILAWKLGSKTMYYTNTPKNSDHDICDGCSA